MTSQPGGPGPATASRPSWPELPLAEWQATRDTLQLWTQIVGKVRMANDPLVNHWWNVPLYLTARGLTTSLMPHPAGPSFQIDFDFRRPPARHPDQRGNGPLGGPGSPVRWPTSTPR